MSAGIPVVQSTFAPLTKTGADGNEVDVLFTVVRRPVDFVCLMPLPFGAGPPIPPPPVETEPVILVHPRRWDAFWLALTQPDIFNHPDVRWLLGLIRPPAPSHDELARWADDGGPS